MAAPAPEEPKQPTTWRQAVVGFVFAALVLGGVAGAAVVSESNDGEGGGHGSEETDDHSTDGEQGTDEEGHDTDE